MHEKNGSKVELKIEEMTKMVTYFNLKDYLNNPRALETNNKLYTASAIHPIDGNLTVVELEYVGPNLSKHGEKLLKYYYYSGVALEEDKRTSLNLKLIDEEKRGNNINRYEFTSKRESSTESGEDFQLNEYLWLGE
jgi:hypothetical protein